MNAIGGFDAMDSAMKPIRDAVNAMAPLLETERIFKEHSLVVNAMAQNAVLSGIGSSPTLEIMQRYLDNSAVKNFAALPASVTESLATINAASFAAAQASFGSSLFDGIDWNIYAPTAQLISVGTLPKMDFGLGIPAGLAGVGSPLWASLDRFQEIVADDVEFENALRTVMEDVQHPELREKIGSSVAELERQLQEKPALEEALMDPVEEMRELAGIDNDDVITLVADASDFLAQLFGHRISTSGVILGVSAGLVIGVLGIGTGAPVVATLTGALMLGADLYIFCSDQSKKRRES